MSEPELVSLGELLARQAAPPAVTSTRQAIDPCSRLVLVPCRGCHQVLAAYAPPPLTGHLYGPDWRRLAEERTDRVALHCNQCGREWHTSERSVARRHYEGQPLLGEV